MTRKSWRLAALGLGFFLVPAARVDAHTTFQGMGEFASGFLHPLTTPPHLLVLLALGIWLGQHQPLRLQEPAAAFGTGSALGLLVTTTGRLAGVPPPLLIVLGLGVGAAVALDRPVPPPARWLACAIAGLVLGLDSGMDAGTPGVAVAKTLSATWVSLLLCVVNVAFYVSRLPGFQWVRIGLRVAGSWIVAVALLMLAFALRR